MSSGRRVADAASAVTAWPPSSSYVSTTGGGSTTKKPLRSALLRKLSSPKRNRSASRRPYYASSPPNSPGGSVNNNMHGGSSVGGASRNSSGGASVTFDLTMSPVVHDDDDTTTASHMSQQSRSYSVDDPNVSSTLFPAASAPKAPALKSSSSFSPSRLKQHHHRNNNKNSTNHYLEQQALTPPRTKISRGAAGTALQFVPAVRESHNKNMLLSPTDTTISTRSSMSRTSFNSNGIPGSSWDLDEIDDVEEKKEGSLHDRFPPLSASSTNNKGPLSSVSVGNMSAASSLLASRARQFRHARRQQQRGSNNNNSAPSSALSSTGSQYSAASASSQQPLMRDESHSSRHSTASAPVTPPRNSSSSSRRLGLLHSNSDSSMQRARRQRHHHHYEQHHGEDDGENDDENNDGFGRNGCLPGGMILKDRWTSPQRSPIRQQLDTSAASSLSFSPSRSLSPLRRPHRLVASSSLAAFSPLQDESYKNSSTSRPQRSSSAQRPAQRSSFYHHHRRSESSGGGGQHHASVESGRVGRMAWLFSSRAAVPSQAAGSTAVRAEAEQEEDNLNVSAHDESTTSSGYNKNTVSPAPSSGSSGFVGWPGTQDKRGATVAILQSSYEDSDQEVAEQKTPSSSSLRRDAHAERLQAARSEVAKWTTATAGSSSSSSIKHSSSSRQKSVSMHDGPPSSSSSSGASSSTPNNNKTTTSTTLRSSLKSTLHYSPAAAAAAVHSNRRLFHNTTPASPPPQQQQQQHERHSSSQQEPQSLNQRWSKMADEDRLSTPGTTYSKTSSAYFNEGDVRQLAYPDFESGGPSSSSSANNNNTTNTNTPPGRAGGQQQQQQQQQQSRSDRHQYIPYGVRLRNAEAAVAAVLRRPSSSNAPTVTPTQDEEELMKAQPPTEESLAAKNRLSPPHRTFSDSKGYAGLMDKTKDVPSLMDAAIDSDNSSRATSTHSARANNNNNSNAVAAADTESDVFDDLSVAKESESDVFDDLVSPKRSSPVPLRKVFSGSTLQYHHRSMSKAADYPERIAEEAVSPTEEQHQQQHNKEVAQAEGFNMVVLGGGLAAIQPSEYNFSNRQTASDYDETLTNSDVDVNGYHRTPGFAEMLKAGKTTDSSLLGIQGNIGAAPRPQASFVDDYDQHDDPSVSPPITSENESSDASLFSDPYMGGDHFHVQGDLGSYYIEPTVMKKVLRKYRKCAEQHACRDMSLVAFERQEDENKAFALFEMRSRIMEKDIERGLERQGGTVAVDDLVMTTYNRTANRVRDAVVVSKAWRDGASPEDVINTALLTRRAERTYYIRRPVRSNRGNNNTGMRDNASTASGYSSSMWSPKRYSWEPVKWVDDTDFMLYRCASLGPRCLRGFEMFTIGDCQSILLKLTNERCVELRRELNDATRRQIEAEEAMREEADEDDGVMTESEMTYLSTMEEVKNISKDLVIAEQSFTLVRDRIEKLVAKYEALLVKIETESFAGASSVVTCESSIYSEHGSEFWDEEEEREAAMWARRARRAEIKAELAAREALLAKQQARQIQEEKQHELEALQQKLLELQSESSNAISEREHSAILARNYAPASQRAAAATASPVADRQETMSNASRIDKEKIDGVKQRFRDRMRAKTQQRGAPPSSSPPPPSSTLSTRYGRPVHRMNKPSPPQRTSPQSSLMRSVGEEMFSHLDFYERSLKSVGNLRD